MKTNPYMNLPKHNFWKRAVAEPHILDIEGLWDPKFQMTEKTRFSTYGSCFAQHIGKNVKSRGGKWVVTEKAPTNVPTDILTKYNYNIFSSRTGNIYTASLLRQWVEWSISPETQSDEVWEEKGRYYDPFRPSIEPKGFTSKEELFASRKTCLEAFKKSFLDCDIFVFTLGLTESWFNSDSGVEYPMCPGTHAGVYDENKHVFFNQGYNFVKKNLNSAVNMMRTLNPRLKIILTVSPVPLVATFEPRHVLVSTMHSKSVLRTVAGTIAAERAVVDYFPSYEIINSPVFTGVFFENNKRSVSKHGVSFVMKQFFKDFIINKDVAPVAVEDLVCEEELLEAFADKGD